MLMPTGHIEKEKFLNEDESLVVIRIDPDTPTPGSHYVAIACHPPGGKLQFRAVELVHLTDAATFFNIRTMFNCKNAEKIIHPQHQCEIDTTHLTLI
jgi:hypothetical protein